MSVDRSIQQAQKPGKLSFLQGARLAVAAAAMVAIIGIAWRWGLPKQWDGRAWFLGFLVFLAVGNAIAFSLRQWPRVAGRRVAALMQRMDPNRRLRLTRDGKILVGITLAVGAAAVNTGNNFLYLVLGLLLALVSVSGVLSEWGLRDIRVCLEEGGERYAGAAGLVAFHVFNLKQRINSMSIEVRPILRAPGADESVAGTELAGRLFLRLPPGARHRGVVRAELPVRGAWTLVGFEVATAYPFGFFRKWKYEAPEPTETRESLVFPNPAPVSEQMRRIRMLVGERSGHRAGQGDEFFSLRDHRPGEDVRRVAWKRSARMGRLMVRENEEPRGRVVTLVVPGGIETPSEAELAAYEQSHRVAAGLVLALLDRGDDVGVVAGALACPPVSGPDARTRLLEVLARARLQEPVRELPPECQQGAVILVEGVGDVAPGTRVHGRVASAAPTTGPERSAA